ncbi:MAG: FAD-binding and (Fe-S)-binding domain-containing protein [Polyangiaceae bacterium]
MIPYVDSRAALARPYRDYLEELSSRGFSGEVQTDYAARLAVATDNSVYQLVPAGVLFPRNEADVALCLGLAGEPRFSAIRLSPRGGGTGTNGQSLCDGLMLDLSRHMAAILETNLAEGWVRVQPGVVLDELNATLKPHGVFFAPNLSPSNRATIGGMIATDASGKGSRVYGKTSQHVLELRAVLLDGSTLDVRPLSRSELATEKQRSDLAGSIYRTVDDVVTTHADAIATALPKLARFLTGYDLAHVWRDDRFELARVICGSEGTLAIVTEAKLKLTKLPKHRQLLAIRYGNFDSALRAATVLASAEPGAIETIDDMIVGLAKKDVIWHGVAHLVAADPGEPPLAAINLVEFESDKLEVVEGKVAELTRRLEASRGEPGAATGFVVVRDPKDIAALWTLRKKGVGLLGNVSGRRRPIPFVEDTAVPPERLADYIRDFRAILDQQGLRYGMFGHVDVGCLHVRPALDMTDEGDEALLRRISDQVVGLTKRYGGVLWGEHGRGFRSEYTPTFFGDELYGELCRVKGAFDPKNQLNPGKLATPPRSSTGLISVDAVKRGKFDRQIAEPVRAAYETALTCNGNGACFDWNPDSVMCPSFKVTRDRIHSPKGRAGVLREWLRLLAHAGHAGGATTAYDAPSLDLGRPRHGEPGDFSHEVYDAMNGCLACKACATQCPIKVDVPELRSRFLSQYHGRYRRPLKDYFVAVLEGSLRLLALAPALANKLMSAPLVTRLLARWVGIVDTPLLAESTFMAGLRARGVAPVPPSEIQFASAAERDKTVLLVQDSFTTYYEPAVALAAYDLLERLGLRPIVLPWFENGKGLHVKGFLHRFKKVAATGQELLAQAGELGVPIVGVEPAVTLTYRDEYVHALGAAADKPRVLLMQEFLAERTALFKRVHLPASKRRFRLFGHCTERTAAPTSQLAWKQVFAAAGCELELVQVGCCGMCGVFGHEAEHLEESRAIFEGSWAPQLSTEKAERAQDLVTGHSCRSQVKRFGDFAARHPVQALAKLYAE